MKYGLARVSTEDQNAAMQVAALKKDGCEKIIIEKRSGGTTSPALLRLLKRLQPGDMLTVWKLDRLGRTLRDLVNIVHDLGERGIDFRSITQNLTMDQSPTGRIMFYVFAMQAEYEHGLIKERTREGVKAAKARGVKFGRKLKLSPQQIEHARKLIDSGEDRQDVAALFKVSRQTLYRNLAA